MNDTADTATLAVIARRIPYIDRRSLSEAWFSALHLVADAPSGGPARERRPQFAPGGAATVPLRTMQPVAAAPLAASARRAAVSGGRTHALEANQCGLRRPRDAASVSPARTTHPSARSYPPFRTSLSLGVNGERGRLLLRREGATLHVVALCRPQLAALVGRALLAADAHLRLRGEAVRASVVVEAALVRA